MKRNLPLALAFCLGASQIQVGALSQGDPEVIDRILEEAQQRSKVWETLSYISEEIGTRLTGSSGVYRANVWARDQFQAYGLSDAHLFKWGEIPVGFDRGPSSVRMVEPVEREFEFTTRAWGAGTDGALQGRVFKEPVTQEELDALGDELEGAWIISRRRRPRGGGDDEEAQAALELYESIQEALDEAGIAGRLVASRNDQVTTGGLRGWRELSMDSLPTEVEISIRRNDYDALNSRLSDGEEVELEADLVHYFNPGPIPVFNTIAEIRGTEFPDEVVIMSAHLDSWNGPGSMGTQDNGTGSSVMLEAARLLMAAEAKPRRTIRFCLWTGEEQGLLGSRGYVDSLSEAELEKISACFVDDGGTNYQGGLACVEDMLPMLDAAVDPVRAAFPDLPIEHSVQDSMPRGGSSDHAAFNAKGVPGFFWIEKGSGGSEGKNYRFVWHTQNDTPRYAVEEYLVQSSACSAVTAYNLAMADSLLPRYVEPPLAAPTIEASFEVADAPINGIWDGRIPAQDSSFKLTLAVNSEGGLSGGFASRRGTGPLLNGSWDSATKTLSFDYKSPTRGTTLPMSATLQEDGQLNGQIDIGGGLGFTAKRASDLPPTEATE